MLHRRRSLGAAVTLLFAGGIMAFSTPRRPPEIPFGWTALGDTSYVITTDTGLHVGGRGFTVATISASEKVSGLGILQQSIKANEYRGKRIQLTGFLKARATDADANLFMRIDGASEVLASDYMEARPIRGTSDWTQYALVLDVPRNAVGITFGFSLVGSGQVWLDDLAIEVVDANDVPTTGHALGWSGKPQQFGRGGRNAYESAPRFPINLDFEQKLIASR